MDFKQFEDKLNSKFEDFQPIVNDDEIWAQVEPQLGSNKKDRKIFLILPLLFFLGLGTMGITWFANTNQSISDSSIASLKEELANQTITADKLGLTSTEVHDELEKNPLNDVKGNQASDIVQSQIVKPLREIANENSSNAPEMSSHSKSKERLVESPDPNLAVVALPNNKNVETSFKEDDTSSKNSNGESTDIEVKEIVAVYNSIKTETAKNELIANHEASEAKYFEIAFTELERKSIPLFGTDFTLDPDFNQAPSFTNEINLGSNRSLMFGIETGVYLSNADYTNHTQSIDFLSELEDAETSLESWDINAYLSYPIKGNWSIKTGINYSRYNEQSINEISGSEPVIVEDTIIGIINFGSITETLMGQAVGTSTFQSTIRRFNSYTYISIPVEILYQIEVHPQLNFKFGLGYQYSIWSNQKGFGQDIGKQEYDLTLDAENRFRDFGVQSALLSAGLDYRLSKSLSWNVGFHSKYMTNGIFQKEESYQKKFHLSGIRTGLNFIF